MANNILHSVTPNGVLRIRFPSVEAVSDARRLAETAPLSYPFVGATDAALPEGWDREEATGAVGRGADDFARACDALRAWKHFALPWVHLHEPFAAIRVGEVAAFSSRQLGLWTLNVCRVVAVYDERSDAGSRFGFSYGTVAGHVVAGEERFQVSWDRATDVVTYGIRKFSRPNHPLVWLAGPVARQLQRRFTVDSLAAMARSVAGAR